MHARMQAAKQKIRAMKNLAYTATHVGQDLFFVTRTQSTIAQCCYIQHSVTMHAHEYSTFTSV
jgi:hypothetical protein